MSNHADGRPMMDAVSKYLPDGVRLRRIVQVGVVVADLDKVTASLSELFGIGPFRWLTWPDRAEARYWYRGKEEAIKVKQAFVQLGSIEVELIQPLEGKNEYKDFLDQKGGGIHHVLFEVSDIEPVLKEMEKAGIAVLQSGSGIRPGTRWALLDTHARVGFLVELRHRPGESDGLSVS